MNPAARSNNIENGIVDNKEPDPIMDIIDYLVHCARINFKAARTDESEVHSSDNAHAALQLYRRSPTDFLIQFGKHLKPAHLTYFDTSLKQGISFDQDKLKKCLEWLKAYHSYENRHTRVRNRRYRALQKLRDETDYFSDKEMMSRNPLLYEQLVGQFLTDEEIRERDEADSENITLLGLILNTVDKNNMRELKNLQAQSENLVTDSLHDTMPLKNSEKNSQQSTSEVSIISSKHWGAFDVPDKTPIFKPEERRRTMISAPERKLLHEEFLNEMFNSFLQGYDTDFDYESIDNDEQYDDLQQMDRDAEDRYFDSETNEVANLEEHMELTLQYKRNSNTSSDDPLDIFMEHLNNRYTE